MMRRGNETDKVSPVRDAIVFSFSIDGRLVESAAGLTWFRCDNSELIIIRNTFPDDLWERSAGLF